MSKKKSLYFLYLKVKSQLSSDLIQVSVALEMTEVPLLVEITGMKISHNNILLFQWHLQFPVVVWYGLI